MHVSYRAFSDELEKIAASKKKREAALYSAAVTAHEAGHSAVHKTPGVTQARILGSLAASTLPLNLSLGRALASKKNRDKDMVAGVGMAAAAIAGHSPTMVDEALASLKSLKKIKGEMSPKEYRTARKKLLMAYGSYSVMPAGDVASGIATATGHPVVGTIGTVAKLPVAAVLGRASMGVKDKRVTARQAKKIVESISPGTPVYASKKPMSGGSMYISPAKFMTKGMTRRAAELYLGKEKDRKLVEQKGAVFIAPTSSKIVTRTPDDFRRV